MLLVILSWIYISFIFFGLGLSLMAAINGIAQKNKNPVIAIPHIAIIMVLGIVATAFLASLLSLFMPLSAGANVSMLVAAVVCMIVFRRNAAELLVKCRNDIHETPWLLVLFFSGFVFVIAYLAAQESSHFDDGLYYATTIKWIEQEGTVKGLANINPRIGFNSTWLLLHALFSFHYLHMGIFNDLNGLLLLFVATYSLGALNRLYRKDHRIAVIVRALMLVPIVAFHFGASSDFIFFNVNFLSSPTADLPVCMLIWLTFVLLLELDERPLQEQDQQVFYIIIISAFLFIVKPSAAPMLLTCVYFFLCYFFKKRFFCAGVMVVAVLLIVGPWIVRNIFISGYIVFPFPAVDVINVDWKLPLEQARWQENAVRVYAIGSEYDLDKPFTVPVLKWFPAWFGKLSFIQSLIFIFSGASIITFLIIFIVRSFTRGKEFIIANRFFIFSVLIAFAGAVFWFMKGPDFRLGYGFTGMLTMLLIAVMLQYFLECDVKYAGYAFTVFFACIMLFYYKNTWKEIRHTLLRPLPERRLPEQMSQVKLSNGVVVHIVFNEDSWYAPLPVSNNFDYYTIRPVPRGATLHDGFKASEKK